MPYNKDQLKAYWQANKSLLNQKRREKRRLAKLGLALEEVSHERVKVSHLEVSHNQIKVSQKTANPKLKVSHNQPENGKPHSKMANPNLAQLIQEWQTQTNYHCASGCSQNKY